MKAFRISALSPLGLIFLASVAFAAPAVKFTAQLSQVVLINWSTSTQGPQKILQATIKTPNKKDLVIGVSLKTALYAETTVKSAKRLLVPRVQLQA